MRHALTFVICYAALTVTAGEASSQMSSLESARPQRSALIAFIAKTKYLAEGKYPGATNEQDRKIFESRINSLAERLISVADTAESKKKVLDEFKIAYPTFEYADTEDRERTLDYFQELMRILGVHSSDGLLNRLMYGFDPSMTVDSRNQEALTSMSEPEREFANKLNSLTLNSAEAFLMNELGRPFVEQENMKIWIRDNDPNNSIALSREHGKPLIIWMLKGRFMFSALLKT